MVPTTVYVAVSFLNCAAQTWGIHAAADGELNAAHRTPLSLDAV
jgi:hypothetical protein